MKKQGDYSYFGIATIRIYKTRSKPECKALDCNNVTVIFPAKNIIWNCSGQATLESAFNMGYHKCIELSGTPN